MEGQAREFGGAFVSGPTVRAIKKVAEIAAVHLSENERAQLRRVTDEDKHNSKDVRSCGFCGYKFVPRDAWRILPDACDSCYELVQIAVPRINAFNKLMRKGA
jgi:hypothetical protein